MSIVILVNIGLVVLVTTFIGNIYYNERYCDYDSCSQKASQIFEHSGRCFDNDSEECKPFLEFWNECQENKKEGEC